MVGISLKMYFDLDQTKEYLQRVAGLHDLIESSNIDVVVIPDFVSILTARQVLQSTNILYGAQDVFWEDNGAYTGEVSARVLSQAGCTFVEIGHAERRRIFKETDEEVGKKAAVIVRNDMIPLVCIGEKTLSQDDAVSAASAECKIQIESLLLSIPDDAEVVFAYEPVWAIGQSKPASTEHILGVITEIKRIASKDRGVVRVIYGGSAQPGLFPHLAQAADGLFLGRFAHDIDSLRAILQEVALVKA